MDVSLNCNFISLEKKVAKNSKDYIVITVLDDNGKVFKFNCFDMSLFDVSKLSDNIRLSLLLKYTVVNKIGFFNVIGCDIVE